MRRQPALILPLVSLVIVLWPWLFGASVPARVDNLIASVPWRSFAHRSLLGGDLPLWNPHNFCGHPLLAFPASAFLYPLEWGALLTGPLVWERLNVVLHHVLACIFMYGFLRAVGVWRPGAVLGAVSFAVGAHLLFHIPWVRVGIPVVWLPFLLWAVEQARTGQPLPWVIGVVGGGVGMTLLGGTPQIAFYVLAVFGLYSVAFTWRRPRTLGALGLGAVLGFVIYYGQYVPSRELWRLSDYAHLTYAQTTVGSLRLWQLPGAFLGGAENASIIARVNYVGVLMLVMVPFAFGRRATRTRALFLAAMACGAVALSLGSATPLHRILWWLVPPMRSFRAPARCLFVAGTALCVLGAMGSQEFLRRRGALATVVTLAIASVLVLDLCGLKPGFLDGGVTLSTLGVWGSASCVIGFIARRRGGRCWIAAWALLTADLAWYGMVRNRDLERAWVSLREYGAAASSQAGVLGAGAPYRVIGTALPAFSQSRAPWHNLGNWLVPNLETLAGIDGVQGYSPLKLGRYDEFFRLLHGGSSGAVDRHLVVMQNPYTPCLDLMRVRYLLWPSGGPSLDEGLLTLAEQKIVRPGRPLEVQIGPCMADSIAGLRIVGEVKAERELRRGQRVASLELTLISGPTWQIPLRAGDHLSTANHTGRGAADFPFGQWLAVRSVRVALVDGINGGIDVRRLAARVSAAGWKRCGRWDHSEGVLCYERVVDPPEALVFPHSRVSHVSSREGALRRMREASYDPALELVVEDGASRVGSAGDSPIPADIVRYECRRVEIETAAVSGGYLFLGDAYYPGWVATVDGRPEEIVPADVAFRAVRVPSGKHRVVMRYDPQSLFNARLVSGFGMLAVGGLSVAGVVRSRRRTRR